MKETLLILDQTAASAITDADRFLRSRGLPITYRTPYSVSFAGPDAARPWSVQTLPAPALPAGAGSDPQGAGTGGPLSPGTGQVAAVPVQLRPEWCRVWVSTNGEGAAAEAAAAFVEQNRDRSRRTAAAVRALERGIYADDRWPAYEASLRANLRAQGLDDTAIDTKVQRFKKRWDAVGRKAAQAPPEEPELAG
ncbi:MAG: hypothetical protein HY332_14395 [Chloroflexi bacterium]|nr:hypothetical protein [Chloroflexota bacterium]